MMLVAGCSTRKNTAGTRFYHALTTRYNVYFNGNEAYKAGIEAQLQGNKDYYMEPIPLYPIGNKATTQIATADFDRAIEKAQKAIRQHSIKRRPKRKPGQTYTDKYKKWLTRHEFNPFLHRAWMLMGKAQYQKGDYEEAASSFSYIARLYSGQTAITSEALIHLSRCYTALGWKYDAEDALSRVNNDSLPLTLATPYASSMGQLMLSSNRYREAIPYLERTAKHEKNKKQKARCYYLLGQTYQMTQQPQQAYNAYAKVISMSPTYELALSARIRQTEVMPATQSKKTERKLKRISRNENNAEYLDQIYYALGNVYMSQKDTTQAIAAYNKGIEKSQRNGVEKGILLLTLGNIYWQQEDFANAQQAYTEAIGLLDKLHNEYATITNRSEILDELVPHTNQIELQDSLQRLAAMSQEERTVAIDNIIKQLIAKEEEERKLAEEAERESSRQQMMNNAMGESSASSMVTRPGQMGNNTQQSIQQTIGSKQAWYFYNPQLVSQGKTEFTRLWGNRKLEDNWRRKNKTVVALDSFEEIDYSNEDADSINGEGTGNNPDSATPYSDTDNNGAVASTPDSLSNDPHRPEYYLAQIPLTDEAMQESNLLLSKALLDAGVIFKERMQKLRKAKSTLERAATHFPNFEQADEVLYHLYLTELAINYYENSEEALIRADKHKAQLISRFPESGYAKILADPHFVENAVYGKQREDSLYANSYQQFSVGDTATVRKAARISQQVYPQGQHRPKFMFLDAVTRLQEGEVNSFLATLKLLVQQYPENEITDLAAHILKGVQEGQSPLVGKQSFGSIWQRRSDELSQGNLLLGDSIVGGNLMHPDSVFDTARNAPFLLILAYEEGTVNEIMLLFEVARYNFSTFMVKNFDLAFVHERGIGMLQIKSFVNYDEAQHYFRKLYATPQLDNQLSGLRAVIISETNYEKLINQYSFDDYDAFYRNHFSTIPQPELKGYTLDEPLMNLPTEEEERAKEQKLQEAEDDIEGDVIFN